MVAVCRFCFGKDDEFCNDIRTCDGHPRSHCQDQVSPQVTGSPWHPRCIRSLWKEAEACEAGRGCHADGSQRGLLWKWLRGPRRAPGLGAGQ